MVSLCTLSSEMVEEKKYLIYIAENKATALLRVPSLVGSSQGPIGKVLQSIQMVARAV